MSHQHHDVANTVGRTYVPLILVLLAIVAATGVTVWWFGYTHWSDWLRLFMGWFFTVFGLFKAVRWTEFAQVFAEYDVLAKAIKPYGYLYPAIELGLGLWYFLNVALLPALITTVIIMAIGSLGIARAIRGPRKYQCACLGAVINLPLSTVSLIEDVGMGLMALGMIFSMWS